MLQTRDMPLEIGSGGLGPCDYYASEFPSPNRPSLVFSDSSKGSMASFPFAHLQGIHEKNGETVFIKVTVTFVAFRVADGRRVKVKEDFSNSGFLKGK